MRPNFYDCQECPHWDDVNGCWCNAKEYLDDNCEPPEEDIEENECFDSEDMVIKNG